MPHTEPHVQSSGNCAGQSRGRWRYHDAARATLSQASCNVLQRAYVVSSAGAALLPQHLRPIVSPSLSLPLPLTRVRPSPSHSQDAPRSAPSPAAGILGSACNAPITRRAYPRAADPCVRSQRARRLQHRTTNRVEPTPHAADSSLSVETREARAQIVSQPAVTFAVTLVPRARRQASSLESRAPRPLPLVSMPGLVPISSPRPPLPRLPTPPYLSSSPALVPPLRHRAKLGCAWGCRGRVPRKSCLRADKETLAGRVCARADSFLRMRHPHPHADSARADTDVEYALSARAAGEFAQGRSARTRSCAHTASRGLGSAEPISPNALAPPLPSPHPYPYPYPYTPPCPFGARSSQTVITLNFLVKAELGST
ncbi:hypothetical protein C8F04DRAFT_1299998 [Mycena alexandri]|uniref:Uncharacterized protein n=1 Tax=Mycena alexandri TaxID=1745969 RepID=A0AAD6SHB4_9AGAR|nr:hypothetical protein C8F04DRAFT_1299998 [Mycena alexandri]